MSRWVRIVGVTGLVVTAVWSWGQAPPASAQPSTWNFQQADIPAAQPLGNYGKGVLVAVVDTWVDPNQPEFSGRLVDEADCLTGTCSDHQYAPDSCVHGTHVAGTIASTDYGVAPEADILAVQVLSGASGSPNASAACSGSANTVATGIDFAVSKGAKVINLSVGDEVPGLFQSSAISTAVANAAQHGVVVVFAAGNNGVPLTDSYGKDALLVAATGPTGQLASYSNFNSVVTGDVSIAAPGGDSGNDTCTTSTCILSTFPNKLLGLLEGTSMAAPHVSGLAALLLAQDPSRGAAGVTSAIEKTAQPLAGAGAGLIDAKKALMVEAASHPAHPSAPPSSTAPSSASPPPAAQTSGAPSASVSSTGSRLVAVPPPAATVGPGAATTTTTVAGRAQSATPVGQTAAPPAANAQHGTSLTPTRPAGWVSRHLWILVLACVLLGVVLLGALVAGATLGVSSQLPVPSRPSR